MSKIVVDAFPEKFGEYTHLFGNNVKFYEGLIAILKNKSPAEQITYIQLLIPKLENLDARRILDNYGMDLNGIITYLKQLIR